MTNNLRKAVAIIPARGGSKRIPRKNIREFCGLPIIAYSIKAAQDAGCFNEVMVSTDDPEIASIARKFGATVPFMRSAGTSSDTSSTADALLEILAEYGKRGNDFTYFCCLYPTAPFVSGDKLRQAFELLLSSGADSVLPIVRFGYPIWRGLKAEERRVKMIWPENYSKRSQDLAPAYHDAGQFYWMCTGSFLVQKKLFADHSVGIELPESEVQDIDTEEDWKIAELKFQLKVRR